jgi:diacylglycerol kinase family enzyme
VQKGEIVDVDLGDAGGHAFLNTCSFGAYTELVAARERLEHRIGKWPALVVALVRVLRHGEPLVLDVDGRRRRLWLGFIGNGHYRPSGFAPTWREVLDDGVLDVRLVSADHPLARIRLVASVLAGRLGRSTVYEQRLASTVALRTAGEQLTLALDGEVVDVDPSITVHLRPRRLRVFAPHR